LLEVVGLFLEPQRKGVTPERLLQYFASEVTDAILVHARFSLRAGPGWRAANSVASGYGPLMVRDFSRHEKKAVGRDPQCPRLLTGLGFLPVSPVRENCIRLRLFV